MRLALSLLIALLALALPALAAPLEARVAVSVAEVHKNPNPRSEQVTQALLWDRVQVVSTKGSWAQVLISEQPSTPQGYPGWMLKDQLVLNTPATLKQTMTVKVAQAPIRAQATPRAAVLLQAYLGTRLELAPSESAPEGFTPVLLPGRPTPAWVASSALVQESRDLLRDGRDLVESAVLLKGTHYLWGGMTLRGIDCSGLTYTVYRLHGWAIPRDADQQFEAGMPVDSDHVQPGDLLFFGKDTDHITHVGMYMWEGKFVHASSALGGVSVTKLEGSPYEERLQGIRRFLTSQAGASPPPLAPPQSKGGASPPLAPPQSKGGASPPPLAPPRTSPQEGGPEDRE